MPNSDYLELDISSWRKQPSELVRVGLPEVRRKSVEDLLSWEAPKISIFGMFEMRTALRTL